MKISEDKWRAGLTQFYYDCAGYWSTKFNLKEDDAMKLAIKDCLALTHWPYSPKGPEIPQDILDEYRASMKYGDFYQKPISRDGVNKILKEMPNHPFWMKYKACDD